MVATFGTKRPGQPRGGSTPHGWSGWSGIPCSDTMSSKRKTTASPQSIPSTDFRPLTAEERARGQRDPELDRQWTEPITLVATPAELWAVQALGEIIGYEQHERDSQAGLE